MMHKWHTTPRSQKIPSENFSNTTRIDIETSFKRHKLKSEKKLATMVNNERGEEPGNHQDKTSTLLPGSTSHENQIEY